MSKKKGFDERLGQGEYYSAVFCEDDKCTCSAMAHGKYVSIGSYTGRKTDMNKVYEAIDKRGLPYAGYVHEHNEEEILDEYRTDKYRQVEVPFFNPNTGNKLQLILTFFEDKKVELITKSKNYEKGNSDSTPTAEYVFEKLGVKEGGGRNLIKNNTKGGHFWINDPERLQVEATGDGYCCGLITVNVKSLKGIRGNKAMVDNLKSLILWSIEDYHDCEGLVLISGIDNAYIVEKLLDTKLFAWVGRSNLKDGVLLLKMDTSNMEYEDYDDDDDE